MLKENIYKYNNIYSDQGIEFEFLKIKQMYKKNITWYPTYPKQIKECLISYINN